MQSFMGKPDLIRDPTFFNLMHNARPRPDLGFNDLTFTYQGKLYTIDDQGSLQDRGAPPPGTFSRGPQQIPVVPDILAPQKPRY